MAWLGYRLTDLILIYLVLPSQTFLTAATVIILVSLFQWLILYRFVSRPKTLFLVTILGWTLSFAFVSCATLSLADTLNSASQAGNAYSLLLALCLLLSTVGVGPVVMLVIASQIPE